MPYVELHCHSTFSFLDGSSHPIELAGAAAEQGHEALALTDHDGLYGSMELAQACKPLGIRPLTGAEITLDDGSHLTLLCETATGYRNLCLLLTEAHRGTREWSASGTPKPATQPSVGLEHVERHAEGLVCLSGCAREGAVGGGGWGGGAGGGGGGGGGGRRRGRPPRRPPGGRAPPPARLRHGALP